MSMDAESPMKKRDHLISKMSPINEENNSTITSERNYKTPENIHPPSLGSADTPSMISFLKHEISCLKTDSTGK